jgi:hypothetical protein
VVDDKVVDDAAGFFSLLGAQRQLPSVAALSSGWATNHVDDDPVTLLVKLPLRVVKRVVVVCPDFFCPWCVE